MTTSILVTGGAGYIGSVLIPSLLKEGFAVTVVDNLMYNQVTLLECFANPQFEFVKGDICETSLLNKLIPRFDVVVPLAAIVGAPACDNNPTLANSVNRDAQMNIVNSISQDQMVLFPTTNSGYGIGDKTKHCTEESPLRPISEYGRAKVDIEKGFLDKGNVVSFRLATVFGFSPRMRMDLLVNDFVYRAVKDRVLVLFEEHARRNFIHVRDVADTFLFGLDHFDDMKGEPYNVGLSTANLTKRQLAEKIKEHIPGIHIHFAAIGDDPDKRDYLISNEKIEKLMWKAKYSLDDGIRELVKGYGMIRPNIFTNL